MILAPFLLRYYCHYYSIGTLPFEIFSLLYRYGFPRLPRFGFEPDLHRDFLIVITTLSYDFFFSWRMICTVFVFCGVIVA
jgi:hypothetical protein